VTATQRVLIRLAAALGLGLLIVTSFYKGWTHAETDFPNYYTAAVLARQHQPLARFYDWVWFQRQMNYTGTERQLGGYIPQTPLTMLPFMPLTSLPVQTAKQVWLALNLVIFGLTVLLLARLANGMLAGILLIALAGYSSLATNFLLGQYYIFLLFLLTLGVWLLLRRHALTGGFVMGAICMLKLYSAPFLLFFLWKRQWRSLLGMLAACLFLGSLSVAWFGWDANVSYISSVFPRAAENAILDPYHPSINTFTNLLRRTFIGEPELNPHPLFNAPIAFFFLRPALTISILLFPLLAVRREDTMVQQELAVFLIAILLSSPNTASYVYVVALLPITMLLNGINARNAGGLIVAYVVLCLPLHPSYSWLFPKVWILLALLVIVGWPYWRQVRLRLALALSFTIAVLSSAEAARCQRSYAEEPGRRFSAVASQSHSIYASNPAVSQKGIVFESIGASGYILNRDLAFEGNVFHPSVPASGSPIYFELTANGHSRIDSFDLSTRLRRTIITDAINPVVSSDGAHLACLSNGRLFVDGEAAKLALPGPIDDMAWFPDAKHLAFSSLGVIYDSRDVRRLVSNVPGELNNPRVSPDSTRLAFTACYRGIRHIWVEDFRSGLVHEITGGTCNSYAPAWEPDSQTLIFASDCDRGLGLPRLYRAEITHP
jgi:glycosyl transferase family 87/WD40 repeat protein